jgi:hypothetical protein
VVVARRRQGLDLAVGNRGLQRTALTSFRATRGRAAGRRPAGALYATGGPTGVNHDATGGPTGVNHDATGVHHHAAGVHHHATGTDDTAGVHNAPRARHAARLDRATLADLSSRSWHNAHVPRASRPWHNAHIPAASHRWHNAHVPGAACSLGDADVAGGAPALHHGGALNASSRRGGSLGSHAC